MRVVYYQQDIFWEDTDANLKKISAILSKMEKDVDLFILPEMFHAGFTMDPGKVAEEIDGNVVSFLKESATKYNITILGSAVIVDNGNYYNRLLAVNPDGVIGKYDKRHLFSVGGEDRNYKPGNERLIINVGKVRVLPLICYDLRFPVWSRSKNDYDILIYIANWPASRSEVWKTLLKARAIENQCYVVGVNRIGKDASVSYSGDSMVLDAKGKVISNAYDREGLFYADLDMNSLQEFRNKFPVWKDADDFNIII